MNTFTETAKAFYAYQTAKETAIEEIVNGLRESEIYRFGYWEIKAEACNEMVRILAEDTTTGNIFEVIDDEQFAFELAKKAKVGVTPGRYFGKGGEGYVRLSYASSTEHLQESLKRITDFVNDL